MSVPHEIRQGKIMALAIVGVALTVFAGRSREMYVTPPGGYGTNNPPFTNWADAATNIQWAVSAATNGEVVWVTNGEYVLTNQIVITNGITLQSVNGRNYTFLNGNRDATSNRCVLLSNVSAIVRGFCISNGGNSTLSGGGVYCYNGILSDCLVTLNLATNGGGIRLVNGTITNCTVITNQSTGRSYGSEGGGGIYAKGGSGYILNCDIISNYAYQCGGIMVSANGIYLIRGCHVLYNVAYMDCGGIFLSVASGGTDKTHVRECTISQNAARNNEGGGAYLWLSSGSHEALSFSNCLFSGNTARFGGGGCIMYGGLLCNCLFNSNIVTDANNMGGGIRTVRTGAIIRNCTIAGNSSQNTANGLMVTNAVQIVNSLVYSNIVYDLSTNGIFTNCCLQSTNNIAGTGNITNNPLFADFSGGNYRLQNNSPCINAGVNQDWMRTANDLGGYQRIDHFSGVVDMGCYEYLPQGMMFSVP